MSAETPEQENRPMFVASARGHGKRAAQAAWLKQVGDPGIKPGDVVIFEPAGRHWRLIAEAAPTPREHWMKRLFQRGK
jgi:hypothetical protein